MNPARFFSAASLAFGIALALVTPPFCAPDEPAHLYRAWSIASGHWIVNGGDRLPKSLVSSATQMLKMTRGAETGRITIGKLRELANMPLREDDTEFVRAPSDSSRAPLAYAAPSYTPAGYLPSAAAVALGRLLPVSPILLLYAGRIANLLAATALIAWAIATIPFGRWTLALAALTPMAAFTRASLGIDALLVATGMALVAAIVAVRPRAATLLTFLICTVKPGYALVPLLAFAIPKLRRTPVILAILLALVAGTALNVFYVRHANPTMSGRVGLRSSAIAHQPLEYASELGRELRHDAKLLTIETVAYFGWLDAPAPFAFAVFWCCALVIVASIDGSSTLTPFARLFGLLLFVVQIAALITLLHLAAEGRDFVRGLQGRYFLPILPLGLLPLTTISIADIVKARIAQLVFAIGVVQSLWLIVLRYWI